jgi:peptide/nickel transport system substrate-binding protein
MHSTDLKILTNLAPVAKSQMEKAGFKVDMQSMDWQTLVARRAKKDAPSAGGWNAFLTAWTAADVQNPVGTAYLNASCDKALFGWPCNAEMEKLRDNFAKEPDPAKQKAIAEQIQILTTKFTPEIPLGEYLVPIATRKNVTGVLIAPVPVMWNIEVKK